MRGLLGVLFLVSLSALSARAEDEPKPLFKAGERTTLGSGAYNGKSAYLQYGDLWRVKGTYSDYRFDGSTGTTRTIAGRAYYQGENLAAGVNLSISPRNDSYANRAFGLDAAWTFILDDDKPEGESGLQEFELGAFWTQTRHSQIVPATPALPATRDVIINQHDLGVTASLTAWDFTASLDASRSVYDKDFSGLPAAVLLRPRLAETVSLVNGFPSKSGSARLEYSGWRPCVPFVSATSTRYEIQPQPASGTYAAGAAIKWGNAGVDLSYELTRANGTPDTKYFNFGGSLKF